jgi:surface antigen
MKRIALQSILMVAFASHAGAVGWLDDGDQRAIDDTAQRSLEHGKTNEPTEWFNPDTGSAGAFTPIATHQGPDGLVCREYSVSAIIAGREDRIYGTACRMPDGSWQEANFEPPADNPPPPPPTTYRSSNWNWMAPRVFVSGGSCNNGFCIGGSYGYRDPRWYSPFGLHFSYWGHGHSSHYRPHHVRYDRYRSHGGHSRNRHDWSGHHDRSGRSSPDRHERGGRPAYDRHERGGRSSPDRRPGGADSHGGGWGPSRVAKHR